MKAHITGKQLWSLKAFNSSAKRILKDAHPFVKCVRLSIASHAAKLVASNADHTQISLVFSDQIEGQGVADFKIELSTFDRILKQKPEYLAIIDGHLCTDTVEGIAEYVPNDDWAAVTSETRQIGRLEFVTQELFDGLGFGLSSLGKIDQTGRWWCNNGFFRASDSGLEILSTDGYAFSQKKSLLFGGPKDRPAYQ